ncbi:MAG TPA: hypothetical protein VMN39_03025 [Longimicrobiaceae bacterium]|nr:hypothetical protein [Longimicrobiaceae bacterium]
MGLARVDLALAADGLVAVVPGLGSTISLGAVLDPAEGELQQGLLQAMPRLEVALLESLGVKGDGGAGRFAVRVALLPPLCEVRLVELPMLDTDEMNAVLRRSASRHFMGAGRDLVIGSARLSQPGAGTSKVLAAAAPSTLLEAVRIAIESRGWELETIVPAHAAWLRTLDEALPETSRHGTGGSTGPVRVAIAADGETLNVLRRVGPSLEQVRRLPDRGDEGLLDAVGAVPGRAIVLAAEPRRAELGAVLRIAGWMVENGGEVVTAREAAARGIEGAMVELLPPPIVAARNERSRRVAARMMVAAAVLVVAAGAVHLVSLAQSLRSVERQRAELRAEVAPVAAARDSLDAMYETLRQLRELEDGSRSLTAPLVELAVLLPPESHLVSLQVAGDTAVFQAAGGRAGEALAALRQATTLTDVQLEGTIQHQIEGGASAGERFVLSAIVASGPRADGRADPPSLADRDER